VPDTFPALSLVWRTLGRYGGPALVAYVQSRGLQKTLRHAAGHSPFYRRLFAEYGVRLAAIHDVRDLAHLGFFTTAHELRADPWQLLAVPREQIAYTFSSSGTTGQPKTIYMTRSDWEHVANTVAIGMQFAGIGRRDVVQILFCNGEPNWMTGNLLQQAVDRLKGMALPTGNALSIQEQLEIMRHYHTTVVCGTPSYLHRLTEEGRQLTDLRRLGVHMFFLGAEAWSESFRRYLQDSWGALAYDSYGMTEMGFVGGGECRVQDGMHVVTSLIFEVIDPLTGRNLEPGEEGELVVTTLEREAMPLIRYRTGDIAALLPQERCPCGIPTARISRIKGRNDDMICMGTGENFYPAHLDNALVGLRDVTGYQLIVGKDGYKDTLHLKVETHAPSDELVGTIRERLYDGLHFLRHDVEQSQTIREPAIEFLTPGTLRSQTPIKIRRVIDARQAPVYAETKLGQEPQDGTHSS
jgi:phenylacetate-CoA ligase